MFDKADAKLLTSWLDNIVASPFSLARITLKCESVDATCHPKLDAVLGFE